MGGGGSLQTGRTVFSGRHVRGCLLINGLCRVEPKKICEAPHRRNVGRKRSRGSTQCASDLQTHKVVSLLPRVVAGSFTQSNQALPNPFDTGSAIVKRSEPFEASAQDL